MAFLGNVKIGTKLIVTVGILIVVAAEVGKLASRSKEAAEW